MKIYASKQVGPIYYMVDAISVVRTIVSTELIKTSNKPEKGYAGGGSHHYVAFLRSLDKAGRNPNRWVYGVRLDGNKLSNKYKIVPYSFAGNAIKGKSHQYRVKYIAAYDNNTYTLQLVDWPVISIPRSVFEDIEDAIVSDIEGINDKKRLEITQGKRAYRGRTITCKYHYNVKTGGIALNESNVSQSTLNYLLKHSNLNETEERIWILDTNLQYITIKNCITGYIEPTGDASIEQAIAAGHLEPLPILHY